MIVIIRNRVLKNSSNVLNFIKKPTKNKTKKGVKINLVKGIKILLKNREKKRQYGCKRYKNLAEDERQRLAEYRKVNHTKYGKNKSASETKTD